MSQNSTLMSNDTLVQTIPILALSNTSLEQCSKDKLLSMSLEEMRAVQNYFRTAGREPTDVELETIAQTWSEHCKHKTFKGIIDYRCETEDPECPSRIYDDLLKETIVRATQELDKKFCLSVFKDNAGIIDFDKDWAVAFKVETHNHPSALEPYGGAGTGLGGVIRDILGVGLGAKPVLNTDVFCVGTFGTEPGSLPKGTLPPERILSGVIAGVRDYGNRMGIPTSNGAVLFNPGYMANPLVFCGTIGWIPKNKIHKQVRPGDLVVAIGGRTGRDGIHGATFSSLALEQNISASVVQIGNAIVEKKVTEALLRARDKNLYSAVTDCGAGGFSSAVGELGAETGVRVDLEKAPLKYEGLLPWEIWLSESQERMVLSVPKVNLEVFQEICKTEDVECSVIGEFTNTGRLEIFYKGQKIGDLDSQFLHDGIPRVHKKAVWNLKSQSLKAGSNLKSIQVKDRDFSKIVKKLIAHPNIASKRWVVRQYDHEVQGGTVIKSFVGSDYLGPGDASVFRPAPDSWKGVVVSNGINPLYGQLDPYWMAANAIDEALRNLTAVGGTIEHCAILDNFCWGNVHDPEILGGLVRCSQGCYDFAKAFGVPFISGKDSLNNTWRKEDGTILSIPGTLLISAIGVVQDVRKSVTMDFKRQGNLVILLGETKEEFGGSHFNEVSGNQQGQVPKVNPLQAKKFMANLHQAIQKGLIRSCHDISEGGLAVTLAEMCIAGNLGAQLQLKALSNLNETTILFSESATRWVVEVEPVKLAQFKKIFAPLPYAVIGKVQKSPMLKVTSQSNKEILKLQVNELKRLWLSFSDKQ